MAIVSTFKKLREAEENYTVGLLTHAECLQCLKLIVADELENYTASLEAELKLVTNQTTK